MWWYSSLLVSGNVVILQSGSEWQCSESYSRPIRNIVVNLKSTIEIQSVKCCSLLVCNFLVHDKCLKLTTNPCVSVAATIVKVGKIWVLWDQCQLINDFLQESCCPLLDRWENNQRKILQCVSEKNARSSWHQMWGWVPSIILLLFLLLSICLFSCGYATKNVYFYETLRWFM